MDKVTPLLPRPPGCWASETLLPGPLPPAGDEEMRERGTPFATAQGAPFRSGTPLGEGRERRGPGGGAGGASGTPPSPIPSPSPSPPLAPLPARAGSTASSSPRRCARSGAGRSPGTRRRAAGGGRGPGPSQRAASGSRSEADDVFASGSAGAKLGRAVTSPPGHVTPIQINKPPPPPRRSAPPRGREL